MSVWAAVSIRWVQGLCFCRKLVGLQVFWAAVHDLAEFFGGISLALGLLTRFSAGILSATMAMAVYFHLASTVRLRAPCAKPRPRTAFDACGVREAGKFDGAEVELRPSFRDFGFFGYAVIFCKELRYVFARAHSHPLHAIGHVSGVVGTTWGSVSFAQVVKSAGPVYACILSASVLRQAVSARVWLTLLPIIGGVGLATMKARPPPRPSPLAPRPSPLTPRPSILLSLLSSCPERPLPAGTLSGAGAGVSSATGMGGT